MKNFLLTLLFLYSTSIKIFAQPSNNSCQTAFEVLALDGTCEFYLFDGATFDGQDGACPPTWSNGANVWFKFTAQGNAVSISTTDDVSMKLTLVRFINSSCDGINFLACASPGSQLNFINLVPEEEYYIIVSNEKDADISSFELCINNPIPMPPLNNEICNAIVLNPGVQECG